MKNDSRGIALTGANDRTLARYEAAVEQFQTYVGDPIATIDEALGEAPSFVAAHLFKAIVLCTLAERRCRMKWPSFCAWLTRTRTRTLR